MPNLAISDVESQEDLIGTDVKLTDEMGIARSVIGYVSEASLGDSPEDHEVVIEDHLQNRTFTLEGYEALSLTTPPLGAEYSIYWGEKLTEEGWVRVTDNRLEERVVRDEVRHNPEIEGETRIMSETYTAGNETADRYPLYASDGGVYCLLEGRNTLAETLSALNLDQRIQISVGTDLQLSATVTSIDPEPTNLDPDMSSAADGSLVVDDFTVKAEDDFDGEVTIQYDSTGDSAMVRRIAPEEPAASPENTDLDSDPGTVEEVLRGLSVRGNPVEWYDIPWMDGIRSAADIPDGLGASSVGYEIGEVWVEPDNRFELHYVVVDKDFQKSTSRSLPFELASVDTPYTYHSPPNRASQ